MSKQQQNYTTQIKIRYPGADSAFFKHFSASRGDHSPFLESIAPFFDVAIAIGLIVFLLFSWIKWGSPFAWVPKGICSPFAIKFFYLLIIYLCFRPLYYYVKYRMWAKRHGMRLPTTIDFTSSHLILHYKKSVERLNYEKLCLKLILRITQSWLYQGYYHPGVSLLTLQLSDTNTDKQPFLEIDHAVTSLGTRNLRTLHFDDKFHIRDLDTILMFANRFAEFSYDFVYDCKMMTGPSNEPNSIFNPSLPYPDAKQYKNVLSKKIEEAIGRNHKEIKNLF